MVIRDEGAVGLRDSHGFDFLGFAERGGHFKGQLIASLLPGTCEGGAASIPHKTVGWRDGELGPVQIIGGGDLDILCKAVDADHQVVDGGSKHFKRQKPYCWACL